MGMYPFFTQSRPAGIMAGALDSKPYGCPCSGLVR